MRLTGDRCQCSACGLFFNSTAAFDKHRDGPMIQRRCLSDVEMRAKGMAVNARGFWVSALNPQYQEARHAA